MAHRFVSAQHALGRYVVSVLILLTAPLVSAADGGSSSPTVAGITVDFHFQDHGALGAGALGCVRIVRSELTDNHWRIIISFKLDHLTISISGKSR